MGGGPFDTVENDAAVNVAVDVMLDVKPMLTV